MIAFSAALQTASGRIHHLSLAEGSRLCRFVFVPSISSGVGAGKDAAAADGDKIPTEMHIWAVGRRSPGRPMPIRQEAGALVTGICRLM